MARQNEKQRALLKNAAAVVAGDRAVILDGEGAAVGKRSHPGSRDGSGEGSVRQRRHGDADDHRSRSAARRVHAVLRDLRHFSGEIEKTTTARKEVKSAARFIVSLLRDHPELPGYRSPQCDNTATAYVAVSVAERARESCCHSIRRARVVPRVSANRRASSRVASLLPSSPCC